MLKIDSVSQSFPGRNLLLHETSLTISAGESVAVMGPSGSGKSTLLYIAGFLLRPDKGTVWFDNESISSGDQESSIRKQISWITQDSYLIPGLTAYENIRLTLKLAGYAADECCRLTLKSLQNVGLSDRKDVKTASLSGGEKQRVVVARATSKIDSKLFLADEPTASLDGNNSKAVAKLLVGSLPKNAMLLMVTHDNEVAQSCDRVMRIKQGKLIA